MDGYEDRFGGVARLVGEHELAALRGAHVCVIGIGGVGSWTVEALARTGIGALTLVDLDDVCVSNINRQIHAFTQSVGRSKIEVMKERILQIQPECRVTLMPDFFTARSAEAILNADYDYVVDAIDSARLKSLLIVACKERGLRLVTVGGVGGRLDPCRVRVDDLTRTRNDGLLRRVRKELRQNYGFSRGQELWDVPAVFSLDLPSDPVEQCGLDVGGSTGRLDCSSGYGAASFVTGSFGFAAASVVVRELVVAAGESAVTPRKTGAA